MADASPSLVERVLSGDRRAIARALSVVEVGGGESEALIDALYAHTGTAWRLGVTGPPGAGKSTLTDRLVSMVREGGETVAVVAVDPSSPFTGGALLGDRIRMADRLDDDGVFVRSLAARGAKGGLARATEAACDVFDAAGFDVVIVETVGVGQGEVDVAEAADTVLVVLVPESGDAIQALKAGLMEIADVFCVNKADHPNAGRLVRDLRQTLSLRPAADWEIPVLKTDARSGDGVNVLMDALSRHNDHVRENWKQIRQERLHRRIRSAVEESWREEFWSTKRREALLREIERVDAKAASPYAIAKQIRRDPRTT